MRAQEFRPRNNPAPVYYFAYGMLTDPANMPGCHAIGAARLPNHRLEFYQYADVVPHAGSDVRGVLWSLPDGTLSQLDQIEGVPYLYNRKMLPVTVNGQRYEAYVYTMTPRARQTVRQRKPSLGYLQTLARGYMKFGLPDSQIRSALQQLKNPESDLDEAQMNPGAFAASGQEAANRGVMVGYEFEVLVPKKSITDWQNTQRPPRSRPPTLKQMLGNRTIADILATVNNQFAQHNRSADLKSLGRMFKPTSDNNSIWRLFLKAQIEKPATVKRYISFIKKTLQNPIIDNQPHVQQQFLRKIKQKTGYDLNQDNYSDKYPNGVVDNFVERVQQTCYDMYLQTSNPEDDLFHAMYRWIDDQEDDITLDSPKDINRFSTWVKRTYGTNILLDLLTNDLWNFASSDKAAAKKQLRALLDPTYVIPMNNRVSRGSLYEQAALMINVAMSPTFGPMTVFDSYHQDTKALDRWYIEPDGSLRPNPGDTSCEIVGPPTPAAAAMTDLRSFYSLANSLNLYTNSSTGLHVNVSIPDTLDVLKLAVFLGDQYVLLSFGRDNSRFANSVLERLRDNGLPEITDFDQYQQKMSQLVNSISDSHFASINWNGRYVSFRQAGGNYLANQTQIENTVGRFVRAMVIASDPTAYRNEYIKKLTAMAPAAKGRATQVDTRIKARVEGIWVIEIDGAVLRPGLLGGRQFVQPWLSTYAKGLGIPKSGHGLQVILNSHPARNIISAATGLSPMTRDTVNGLEDSAFFRMILSGPVFEKQAKNLSKNSVDQRAFGMHMDSGNRVAVAVKTPKLIKPTDPEFAQAVRNLTAGDK